jgi:pyruvate formate lyase activating enzyme
MKEAYLYEKLEEQKVRCLLCSHHCLIKPDAKGICRVRENRDGTLVSLVYDKLIARHLDPIEKKPLFHFLPGSSSYSIATPGCNLKCRFCQNADISQMPVDMDQIIGEKYTPEELIAEALSSRAASISYTYTEPTVYFELAHDTSRLAVTKGLKNIFVSNGFMTKACLEMIQPDLHAANVDLKSFREQFYKETCGARLAPVLESLENMQKLGIWLEVTTLLIPGLNDSPEELRDIARFLVKLDKSIPWHISRFHPMYRLQNIQATAPDGIHRAREIGLEEGVQFVYSGNLPGDEGENTFCPHCKTTLIERYGFMVRKNKIKDGKCSHCGVVIPGVWK